MTTVIITNKETGNIQEYGKAYYRFYLDYIVVFSMKLKVKLASFSKKKFSVKTSGSDLAYDRRLVYIGRKCPKCRQAPLLIISNVYPKEGKDQALWVCINCKQEGSIEINLGAITI